MNINGDKWQGDFDGNVTMLTKHLVHLFGCRVDVHKFVGVDAEGCFHTHPALAVRVVLWGGYVEQLESGFYRAWRMFDIGLVRPELSHRVALRLGQGPVYTLWIRGRTHGRKAQLRGSGWPKDIMEKNNG